MIKDAVHKMEMKAVRMPKSCPVVSHLFFADDAVFFTGATDANALRLRSIIELYCRASGQAVNLWKSSILFSRNANSIKD